MSCFVFVLLGQLKAIMQEWKAFHVLLFTREEPVDLEVKLSVCGSKTLNSPWLNSQVS